MLQPIFTSFILHLACFLSHTKMVSVAYGTLLWILAIPTVSMLSGMLLVQFWAPGPRLTSLLQATLFFSCIRSFLIYIKHFAAGVVFCAVAAEVLPELLDPSVHEGITVLCLILIIQQSVGLCWHDGWLCCRLYPILFPVLMLKEYLLCC